MSFYGGDTDQMRTQGDACEQAADLIRDTTDLITQFIDAVPWFGPDAAAFRAFWHGTVKPMLYAKADDLQSKGRELHDNADEQDQISASY